MPVDIKQKHIMQPLVGFREAPVSASNPTLSFLALGGLEDVTRNMYLYEYNNQILIVDCGLGFADETMLGVDLLLPDISYLLDAVSKGKKKIVGMLLSHGHEDHIGALPFALPQLPQFPIYASPFTAALANEKLREFRITTKIQPVPFNGQEVTLGVFKASFIRITHSVPDTANIVISCPGGTIYHGSDFKFDLTPADGKKTDFGKIAKAGEMGVLGLMCDSLGSERVGFSKSEESLEANFEDVIRACVGKCLITTYSSNIARLNQAIVVAEKLGRNVCFVGKSLIKTKNVAKRLGYLKIREGTEVQVDEVKKIKPNQLLLIVAGSQGQENSAMTRVANDEHREISLSPQDIVILSSDTIPGNEVVVHNMIDAIAKKGAKVIYKEISGDGFHVSGHGSQGDLLLMMSLVKAKYVVPISGTYRQMVAFSALARKLGYSKESICLLENGQELVFTKGGAKSGRRVPVRNVYVDEISGEEVESFVLRDRERLAKEGIVILMVEISSTTGQVVNTPDVVVRGFSPKDAEIVAKTVPARIQQALAGNTKPMKNWVHARRIIEDTVSNHMVSSLHRRPLILPVVIEV